MDFLIHLRHDKGLSVSAVKGYSSALNSVLALKGRDVALVLQSLTGAPYEPLRTCDERFLA